ncbi:hypothetical protein ACCAA_10160 [Candidatus Accumulibacter aalborgensis]|uniref:Uncharacterized protein n=1 Tax=Candidatus Accumulibacter aalborgensis TaxID=1860102 RepID=A0A1A8XET5_9PROT|nr:hypothetical protein ACCAA_10160 [Candidatus Accumulibacter aalborgensis]
MIHIKKSVLTFASAEKLERGSARTLFGTFSKGPGVRAVAVLRGVELGGEGEEKWQVAHTRMATQIVCDPDLPGC